MKSKKLYLLVLFAFLTGCQEENIETVVTYPPSHKIQIVRDTLIYNGMITGDAVLEALRLVRESDKSIKKLKITSSGGDMAVGIEFGYFVKERGLDVEVSELCFSSCANYVLPAAKSVVINTNSLIGWHGGTHQSDELWEQSVPQKDRSQFMAYLNRLRVKETVFFNYVGVDQKITTYGQTVSNSCQVEKNTSGWYYSVEDLRTMGIKDITIKGAGLLTEIDYKNNGAQINTTNSNATKITSCLLNDVFES
ncbi:hypothetical protein ATG66_2799 [Vibrio sp. ES.051]|uniref:hypothetical protein n=1 Tax=Vibrio sp. ES.051 TaxID=1761909 RepID=UPI000BF72CD3|nr:hypothetical protein [Vibrio sp. ES.051]PFG56465.1 hypothetical protein ATG66_2799 [Vibrio sp. ES.051]